MDFRANAAESTRALLNRSPGRGVGDLGESGCIPIPGGRRVAWIAEMPVVVIQTACMLCAIGILPLTMMGVVPYRLFFPVLLIGFGVSLVLRKVKAVLLKAYLASRVDGLLKAFGDIPSVSIGLEDGQTYKKLKLVVEDVGECLLDAAGQRLLIEGCEYRYVIYARDVYLVEPVSGYAMSGAHLKCRMSGNDVSMVLMQAGQGPLASLTQSFAPSVGAAGLAGRLTQTLFGSNATSYKQDALPPPLPG